MWASSDESHNQGLQPQPNIELNWHWSLRSYLPRILLLQICQSLISSQRSFIRTTSVAPVASEAATDNVMPISESVSDSDMNDPRLAPAQALPKIITPIDLEEKTKINQAQFKWQHLRLSTSACNSPHGTIPPPSPHGTYPDRFCQANPTSWPNAVFSKKNATCFACAFSSFRSSIARSIISNICGVHQTSGSCSPLRQYG